MIQLRKITECQCGVCKQMCKDSPCMGTPADIQKIIDAGFKDRLIFTIWLDHKSGNSPMPAIAPIKEVNGCVFQNTQGLCELHSSNLKPTEGKLAIHDLADDGLRRTVGFTWISQEGIAVFNQFEHNEDICAAIREMIPFVKKGGIHRIG